MNQGKIGVAIVGTGFGQKVHIPGFQAHHRTDVVAVYHRDMATAQKIATAQNIPYASDSLTDILARPEVDAIAVSTPPFLHYQIAKAVLEAKKHLLLEKPTTLNAQEAKELYQITQSASVIATMDFEFRFIPAWQYFSQLLAQKLVGNIRLIKIDWLGSSRADVTRPWNWYSSQAMGGGALGSLGSHAFDYIYWLFGEVDRLNAHFTTAIPQRLDPASKEMKAVDSDDTCMLSLELADGTPCQVSISAVVHASRPHWVEVYGDKGTLVLGSENQKDYIHGFRVWSGQPGESLTEMEIPSQLLFPHDYPDGRISAFLRVVDNWVQAIDRGETIVPGLREGVYSQLLMDLAQESHQRSQWVNVPDLDSFLI